MDKNSNVPQNVASVYTLVAHERRDEHGEYSRENIYVLPNLTTWARRLKNQRARVYVLTARHKQTNTARLLRVYAAYSRGRHSSAAAAAAAAARRTWRALRVLNLPQ